jgi:geranylgeranyl diphosphate synthase, type II
LNPDLAAPIQAPRTPEVVRETLAEYGAATRRAVLAQLQHNRGEGEAQRYLYDLLADYPQRGGKMMRSSLCIATARALGARLEDALPTAVAIELLHNALLVHDDIQDGSLQRRGRPTLHGLHGMQLALNAGDALGLLSLQPLLHNLGALGGRLALRIFQETERMCWESAEGQAMELGWRRDNRQDLHDEDYLVMVLKKTCWLATIHPCRVGALIGGHGRVPLEPFQRFGFFLGAAFQIQDDLLNLVADDAYGKELNGDLVEGKRTLMLNHVIEHATPRQRQRLARVLDPASGPPGAADVTWMRGLMDRYGSIEHARGIAHGLAGCALHEYTVLMEGLPESRDKQFIRGLVTWVFERA